jgi:hypothetical protein
MNKQKPVYFQAKKNNLNIAFDVNGTLDSSKKDLLIQVIEELQNKGHECFVWSSDLTMARNFVRENNLNCDFLQKYYKKESQLQNKIMMDISIDDDKELIPILSAKRVLLVHNLPSTVEEILKNLLF